MKIGCDKIIGPLLALCICFVSSEHAGHAGQKFDKGKNVYPYDFELRLGWGGYPFADANNLGYSPFARKDVIFYHQTSLESIYADRYGPLYMTGVISAEFDMNFRRWFSFTVGVGVDGIFQSRYDALDGNFAGRDKGAALSIMPEARFNWLNTDAVRMYSAIGIGGTLSVLSSSRRDETRYSVYWGPQLTLVGISAGYRVYAFAECGLGIQYCGAMAGIGFRF